MDPVPLVALHHFGKSVEAVNATLFKETFLSRNLGKFSLNRKWKAIVLE